jgi:hypothetical protein
MSNKLPDKFHQTYISKTITNSRHPLICIRCTIRLLRTFHLLAYVWDLVTYKEYSSYKAISVFQTCTHTSSLKFPSTSEFLDRVTNCYLGCFKLSLSYPKTVSSWKILQKQKKMKHKCNIKRKKKRRNLTLKSMRLKKS